MIQKPDSHNTHSVLWTMVPISGTIAEHDKRNGARRVAGPDIRISVSYPVAQALSSNTRPRLRLSSRVTFFSTDL